MGTSSKALSYVRLRLHNSALGANEAARQAGFAGGRPSPQARQLWSMLQELKADPGLAKDLELAISMEAAQARPRADRAQAILDAEQQAQRAREAWSCIFKLWAETRQKVSGGQSVPKK